MSAADCSDGVACDHLETAALYALYIAHSISLVGNAVAQLATPWYVCVTTGSPALTGLTVFFNIPPAVIAAFFGGIGGDRAHELRGRVFGATRAGAWASIPLGILLGGVVVQTLGVVTTLLGIGVCYLAVTG